MEAERRAKRVSLAGTEERDMAGISFNGFVLLGKIGKLCLRGMYTKNS